MECVKKDAQQRQLGATNVALCGDTRNAADSQEKNKGGRGGGTIEFQDLTLDRQAPVKFGS